MFDVAKIAEISRDVPPDDQSADEKSDKSKEKSKKTSKKVQNLIHQNSDESISLKSSSDEKTDSERSSFNLNMRRLSKVTGLISRKSNESAGSKSSSDENSDSEKSDKKLNMRKMAKVGKLRAGRKVNVKIYQSNPILEKISSAEVKWLFQSLFFYLIIKSKY